MTGTGIAVRHHCLDCRPLAAQRPKGSCDEEALAVLRYRVGQDEPREDAAARRIVEAGVMGDDRAGGGDREDRDALQRPGTAVEADRELRGWIAWEIVMPGDEGARFGMADNLDTIGGGIDELEVARPERASLAPSLAAVGMHRMIIRKSEQTGLAGVRVEHLAGEAVGTRLVSGWKEVMRAQQTKAMVELHRAQPAIAALQLHHGEGEAAGAGMRVGVERIA